MLNALSAEALQVVYPKNLSTQVNAASTFFIGSTEPGSSLKINEMDVKVYENGSFVQVVPLNDGENTIKVESTKDQTKDTITYIIKKVPKPEPESVSAQLEEFSPDEYMYASVVKDNTPLRAQPDENAARVTHLNNGTVLMINGKKGGYYRVSLTPSKNVWVRAENIVNYSKITGKMLADASNVSLSEDKFYNYIKTDLSFAVPYKVSETDTGLNLELYNIKNNAADTILFKTSGSVKTLAVNTVCADNTSSYFVELNTKMWGYDVFYEGNTLVLKIRKAPVVETSAPLKGIKIAIDAGHGGDDAGAIGQPDLLKLAMQTGWTLNVLILEADLTLAERAWYLNASLRFGWTKTTLKEKLEESAHLNEKEKVEGMGNEDLSTSQPEDSDPHKDRPGAPAYRVAPRHTKLSQLAMSCGFMEKRIFSSHGPVDPFP